MNREPDIMLQLDAVTRAYPRDLSHIASAVLREMLLPMGALRTCPPTHFDVLRNVRLALARGEKAGILGAHRSGKSTLAGIASGQLQPTSGAVMANGKRSLIAKPGAGFRPGLTVIENLSFRAVLAGVTGDAMHALVDRTLSQCGVSSEQAGKAIGNLSRFVTRQLGLTLLLELPGDILVIDEVTGAGTGDARWALRGRLQDRIEAATSLVLSADAGFVRDLVEQCWVLHGGRLYGPFEAEQAAGVYERLPPEDEAEEIPDAAFDPLDPPSAVTTVTARGAGAERYEADDADPDENPATAEAEAMRRKHSAQWHASSITVDGQEYRHSRESLLRSPDATISIVAEIVSLVQQDFAGGTFGLFGSDTGIELARHQFVCEAHPVAAGQSLRLRFELVVHDWGESFYGLAFSPKGSSDSKDPRQGRIKILIVGLGGQRYERAKRVLDIRGASVEFAAPEAIPKTSALVAAAE